MQLSPLPGYVFIEYVEPVAAGGLIALPGSLDTKERSGGQIVAVAEFKTVPCDCCPDCCPNFVEGMDRVSMESKAGQFALFKPRHADVFSIKGRTFFSVKEDDLLLTTDTIEDFQRLAPVTA